MKKAKSLSTQKARTINACLQQADKYNNPKTGDILFTIISCFLCKIHHIVKDRDHESCCGCPLSSISCSKGCIKFNTYQTASQLLMKEDEAEDIYALVFPSSPSRKLLTAFKNRAKFYVWLSIELEKYPASQFTKKGWKYFGIDTTK